MAGAWIGPMIALLVASSAGAVGYGSIKSSVAAHTARLNEIERREFLRVETFGEIRAILRDLQTEVRIIREKLDGQ